MSSRQKTVAEHTADLRRETTIIWCDICEKAETLEGSDFCLDCLIAEGYASAVLPLTDDDETWPALPVLRPITETVALFTAPEFLHLNEGVAS